MNDLTIRVEGLRDLRRDMKLIDRALPAELNKASKAAADAIVRPAKQMAPKRTGRLAASIKAGTRGDRVTIRSSLPYANPIHWGWPSRGIPRRPFISQAAEQNRDQYVDRLGDAIEDLARRHGFNR